VPQWAWILIFWVLFLSLSMLGVLAYGEVEFWLALIKYVTSSFHLLTGNPDILPESFLFLSSSLLLLLSPPVVLAGRKLALNTGTILVPLRMGLMAWQRHLWYVFRSRQSRLLG
jgi:hypothetical protein